MDCGPTVKRRPVEKVDEIYGPIVTTLVHGVDETVGIVLNHIFLIQQSLGRESVGHHLAHFGMHGRVGGLPCIGSAKRHFIRAPTNDVAWYVSGED